MKKSRELLLTRYISFFILIFQLFIRVENRSIVSLIFILMLIINNHLRIFYFKKDFKVIVSIIVELLVVPIAQIKFGGSIVFYLIGMAIDIFSLRNKVFTYILGAIILFVEILINGNENIEEAITYFVLFIMLFMFLNYISRLYSTKIESQNLYDKLRVSEEKLIKANTELEAYIYSIEELTLLKERNRISREIHDSVGHALSTAMIQLSAMEAVAQKENSKVKDMAKNLRMFINESFKDVKRAVNELKSDEYDNYQGILRIQEVCNNFEKMSGIQVKTVISKGNWNLSTKQANHLYRISQEVLSNSLRHGKATIVKVIMNFTDDDFIISFKDNGIGTLKIEESGVGLKSIKERVAEIDGTVDMKSSYKDGFFVKVTVPREREI
ncbi:MAG: sensor histidine kinase [Clostridium sp.]